MITMVVSMVVVMVVAVVVAVIVVMFVQYGSVALAQRATVREGL